MGTLTQVLKHLDMETSPIRKYLYLRDLHDRNETLFHRVVCYDTLVDTLAHSRFVALVYFVHTVPARMSAFLLPNVVSE